MNKQNASEKIGEIDEEKPAFFSIEIWCLSEKKDKTTVEVAAFTPFLVINGEGYRADYGACEDLSVLGNRILGNRRNEDGG